MYHVHLEDILTDHSISLRGGFILKFWDALLISLGDAFLLIIHA